jgi:hypothetical protein
MKTGLIKLGALLSAISFVGCTIVSLVFALISEIGVSVGFGLLAFWWFVSLIIFSVLNND